MHPLEDELWVRKEVGDTLKQGSRLEYKSRQRNLLQVHSDPHLIQSAW
jgi:hypothetical protein